MNRHENQPPQTVLRREGPWRLESPQRDATDINSSAGLAMSPDERYTGLYGPRGEGWDFDTSRYERANRQREIEVLWLTKRFKTVAEVIPVVLDRQSAMCWYLQMAMPIETGIHISNN